MKGNAIRNGMLSATIFWGAIILMIVSFTRCTNWQGMEFRIGVGQYNGAQETKTFTREDGKK